MTYLLIQNYNRLTKLVRQAFPLGGESLSIASKKITEELQNSIPE